MEIPWDPHLPLQERAKMFGPIMQIMMDNGTILVLKPLQRDDMGEFLEGIQRHSVTQYLGRRTAPVIEDEYAWFEKVRTNQTEWLWGIYLYEGETTTIIGSTGLHNIHHRSGIISCTSGFLIFRQEHWRKGFAKVCHRARTMYAFDQLALHEIRSGVMEPNIGSRKALQRVGYVQVSKDFRESFVNGQSIDKFNMLLVNPDPYYWQFFWREGKAPREFVHARLETLRALEWARQHIVLL